ncbi:hypothetical protein EJ06DRAFT_578973 [Trichodelitschia bisporula]|uniref:Rad21/Rec8-like protein N-terminal domain-containing protein n=1 Tax=Trichodelitschia bisporula TaxID=703511 RepID=A0A6G1I7N8_9PEZI|nr:hypothetical protein EJ06DRAFT_578973 [Trichodelitschia bisporula]
MFYSHEVLTSRKLVATLGQKSTLKKVTRKAILEVDVPKACETISKPEAPMALRLQSNLLYGVARVHAQQCDYVLSDARVAQNQIRISLSTLQTHDIDETPKKARPPQLLLEDDPSFLPDLLLDPLDDELTNLDTPMLANRVMSGTGSIHTWSSPTPGSRLGLASSPSIGDMGAFSYAGSHSRAASVVHHHSDTLGGEDNYRLPDIDFEFDDEGNIREYPQGQSPHVTPRAPRGPQLPSDASSRVRREHEEGRQLGANLMQGDQMDIDAPVEDGFNLADTSPLRPSEVYHPPGEEEGMVPSSPGSEYAEAVAEVRRKPRTPKLIQLDTTVELRNRDLIKWNEDYLDRMAENRKRMVAMKAGRQAKINAEYWTLGVGINNIGSGIGLPKAHPLLAQFSGESLYALVTGDTVEITGQKRAHKDNPAAEEDRRVRARTEEDQVGRGDDAMIDDGPLRYDDEPELPREAESGGLGDVSSALPWSVSARGSSVARAPVGSTSRVISGGRGSRAGSRLPEVSPLMGHSRPSGLDILPSGGRSSSVAGFDFGGPGSIADDDFELYGPAAMVDTQTADQYAWQMARLDDQAREFLNFVETTLENKAAAAAADDGDQGQPVSIEFEELLPPKDNSRVVAAQSLMHVLTLAMRHKLKAKQSEAFGPITLSLFEKI